MNRIIKIVGYELVEEYFSAIFSQKEVLLKQVFFNAELCLQYKTLYNS